jgi:hypothetical protein
MEKENKQQGDSPEQKQFKNLTEEEAREIRKEAWKQDQKRLSSFMKKSNGDEPMDADTFSWWMNRY